MLFSALGGNFVNSSTTAEQRDSSIQSVDYFYVLEGLVFSVVRVSGTVFSANAKCTQK